MKSKANVLVVDDDSGIGEMLKTLLEFYDYNVKVSELPDKTEDFIREEEIDIVILDMLISGVHGTDVCARLRANEEFANTPILMMSALHDAGKKCRAAGADDFIAKPLERDGLTERIEKVLNDRRS